MVVVCDPTVSEASILKFSCCGTAVGEGCLGLPIGTWLAAAKQDAGLWSNPEALAFRSYMHVFHFAFAITLFYRNIRYPMDITDTELDYWSALFDIVSS